MATPYPRNVTYIPGRLVKDPTNLATARPHGGTYLGMTRAHRLIRNARHRLIRAEEFMGTTVDKVVSGESPIFAAILREFDVDAVNAVFPGAQSSTSGSAMFGHAVTQATRAGSLGSDRAHALLFSPHAADYHPAVILYKAIPAPDVAAEIQLRVDEEIGTAVAWYAIPDATGRVYDVAMIGDITL